MSLRSRFLPTLIFFSVLMLGLRVGDVWRNLSVGQPSLAQGADKSADKAADNAQAGKPAPEKGSDPAVNPATAATATAESRGDPELTEAQLNVLQHLSERHQELDNRAHDLDQREALLNVAEQRLDEKMAELKSLRAQLEDFLKQEDDQQKAQTESLVKIYEDMKPKDAARIFDALDMPVLLNVMAHMKESKSAPILAAMDPGKAKDVTLSLASRHTMPAMAKP